MKDDEIGLKEGATRLGEDGGAVGVLDHKGRLNGAVV